MKTSEGLVNEFAEAVAAQSAAIVAGDAALGNEHAKRYIQAFKELRLRGDAGRDALAALLLEPRVDVRVMAASYLLRHCGPSARAVLEAEANGPGLVAFGAAQALQRWREGNWALDVV